MKTSKIILFSYIGLLATAFLVFVIYLSAAEDTRHTNLPRYTTFEKDVPSFKYIHVKNIMTQIVGSEKSYISTTVIENSSKPDLSFNVVNDTLYIVRKEGINNITLHLDDISSLTLISRNANVNIKDINTDTLNYIGFENSQLNGFYNSNIGMFNVDIYDSRLNSTQGSIEQLILQTEKSSVNIRNKMNSAKVQLTDNSDVRLGNVDKIDLEKDESSKFYSNP